MNLNKLMGGKRKVKDNVSLNYKDNREIEDVIFEKITGLSFYDFVDRGDLRLYAKIGLTIKGVDKDMSELGYSFVKETQGSSYGRVYEKGNIVTYLFFYEEEGTDNKGKRKSYLVLECANSYYKNGVSDSRRVKDSGQFVSKNEKYQKIKKDIIYEANTILDNLNNGADWYDYSYFNWFSVYEDGQPMTARVYSNNDSDWQFDVYLKNEREEMMLNVMQNYGDFLRFNGTDYVNEGRTSDAISFDTFLAIFVENLIEGTM